MNSTAVRKAAKIARFARRSFKGGNSSKGFGKVIAHRAERRLSKALAREEG